MISNKKTAPLRNRSLDSGPSFFSVQQPRQDLVNNFTFVFSSNYFPGYLTSSFTTHKRLHLFTTRHNVFVADKQGLSTEKPEEINQRDMKMVSIESHFSAF